MKNATTTFFLLLIATPVMAASYSWPSDVQPQTGDLVHAADGQIYEITDACTLKSSSTIATNTVFAAGGIPCHDFVSVGANVLRFRASGTLVNQDCTYTEFFTCPATLSEATDAPLDMGKAISFLLGGLTGFGFVMASSMRW